MKIIKQFFNNLITKAYHGALADIACSEFRNNNKELFELLPKRLKCSLCKKENKKQNTNIILIDTTQDSIHFICYCRKCILLNLKIVNEYMKTFCQENCSKEEYDKQLKNANSFVKEILQSRYKETLVHSLFMKEKERHRK